MASYTLTRPDAFPEGTVKAYSRAAWHPTQQGAPSGVSAAEATVSGGSLVFTGLVAGAAYVAYANINGSDRYVEFVVPLQELGESFAEQASNPATPPAGGGVSVAAVGGTLVGVGPDGVVTKLRRAPNPQPSDQALLAWSIDPVDATTTQIVSTAGTVNFARIPIREAMTITNLLIHVTTGNGTPTAGQNLAALFSGAGELLSATADQSTAWETTGLKTMALTTPQAVPAGSVIVGFFSNGTTQPTFACGAKIAAVNAGVSGIASRFGTADAGRTTSFPAALGSPAALAVSWFVAVS